MGVSKRDKKRKKGENSPGTQAVQPDQKKMASYSSPPSSQPQASAFQIPSGNYCIPPQYYNVGTPITPVANTPLQNIPMPGSEVILNKILDRLDQMDNKLKSLDTIEKSLHEVKTQVTQLEDKYKQMETSRQYDAQVMTELSQKQSTIDKLLVDMKEVQKSQETKETELRTQMLDLKCREMRDNLLFYNIDEERGETSDDCARKVLKLIEESMEVQNAQSEIKLHRAHRIGKFDRTKTRPIVAKFTYYPDREKVREAAPKLRGSKYGVSQQFPKEIQDKRRALVPIMKQAREEGKEAYISVDKLYINGQLYRGQIGGGRI